jgi:hypothetical protein|tara:strand:- start:425 stop:691 length:267 start_codon:yes stop_codon:yes gene_type:complete
MPRLQFMILEIGALLLITITLRIILSGFFSEDSNFLRFAPILGAILIVYTVRFRIRKKIRSKNTNLNERNLEKKDNVTEGNNGDDNNK